MGRGSATPSREGVEGAPLARFGSGV
jgi:hypothetical protein